MLKQLIQIALKLLGIKLKTKSIIVQAPMEICSTLLCEFCYCCV